MDDGEVAVAAGGEDITGRGIETGSIRAFADGGGGDDFAGVYVHHGHHFFVADGKSAANFDVHGETGRRFAGRERPVVELLESRRIDVMKLGAVFIVHVDGTFAIGGGEFGLAAQVNVAEHGAVGGVNRSGILAAGDVSSATVEGEDALGDGLVEDGIGIDVGFDIANGLQGFEVEDGDVIRDARR